MPEHYSATLYGAAKLIEKHGLAVGGFRDDAGRLDVVGAIFVAGCAWGRETVELGRYEHAPARVWVATERLEEFLDAELGQYNDPAGRIGLSEWSDRVAAVHGDGAAAFVAKVLRKCANAVRAEA